MFIYHRQRLVLFLVERDTVQRCFNKLSMPENHDLILPIKMYSFYLLNSKSDIWDECQWWSADHFSGIQPFRQVVKWSFGPLSGWHSYYLSLIWTSFPLSFCIVHFLVEFMDLYEQKCTSNKTKEGGIEAELPSWLLGCRRLCTTISGWLLWIRLCQCPSNTSVQCPSNQLSNVALYNGGCYCVVHASIWAIK